MHRKWRENQSKEANGRQSVEQLGAEEKAKGTEHWTNVTEEENIKKICASAISIRADRGTK